MATETSNSFDYLKFFHITNEPAKWLLRLFFLLGLTGSSNY